MFVPRQTGNAVSGEFLSSGRQMLRHFFLSSRSMVRRHHMQLRAIITAAVLSVASGAATHAETYRDPQQRFTVNVPAGWTAEPFEQGVQLKRGSAFCVVLPGRAATPEDL